MSKHILKDFLGTDGRAELKGLEEKWQRKKARRERRIDEIFQSVLHFERKMTKRREVLRRNLTHSQKGTYNKNKQWWKEEYQNIMKVERLNEN